MSKAVIQLVYIDCLSCFSGLQELIEQENGVLSVKVFPRVARIRAEYDKKKVSAETLCRLIEEQGFIIQSYLKKG